MESRDLVNSGVIHKSGYEGCISCLELQYKLTEANEKCARLEFEIGKKNCVIRDDADGFTQLMIENKVLECEKNEVEREVGVWKAKCKALETEVMELEKRLSAGITKTSGLMHGYSGAGGPSVLRAEIENKANADDDDDASGSPRFRTPYKNVSPSTPAGMPRFATVNINDTDDDEDLNTEHLPLSALASERRKKELTLKDISAAVVEQESNEEETTRCSGGQPYRPMAKRRKVRKRPANIFYSESESDSDDNIPLSRRSKKRTVNTCCSRGNHKVRTPRKRLVRLADHVNKGVSGKCSYKSTRSNSDPGGPEMTDNLGDDETEEDRDDSSSEGESLDSFIVNTSDVSERDGTLAGDNSADSENSTESSTKFTDVVSALRRERKDKTKWEYSTDMLADFDKFPELCMKGVCALYRQQTCEEKSCRSTIQWNGRGFSTVNAYRGSELAEFLTDGDPQSDVRKSVVELEEFDPNGVEECRKLATKYSNQLFEIYNNKEDPFFHPLIPG